MKRTNFLIAACLAFTLAGCSDEDIIKTEVTLPVSGDEIAFGANTQQFSRASSRTQYGEPDDYENYGELTINWQPGQDQVRVYSSQAASGFQSADYTVLENTPTGTTDGSSSYYLQKNGESGVRWGNTSQDHKFYAFYPLKVEDGTGGESMISGLTNNTVVSASIPVAQERGNIVTKTQNGTTWKIVAPNMTYAMMAGSGTWTLGDDRNVSLNFKPIVLVLDVVVNAGETAYNVLGVSVRSKDKPIVGNFKYDIATEAFEYTSPSSDNNNLAYVDCQSNNQALTLNPGEKLNVKFFLLPQNIKAGQLTVSVLLENGQTLRQALVPGGGAEDGAELIHGEIVKVRTPKINPAQTSDWMSMIPNNVLFASQLSLPGTKHSYTYQLYNGPLAYESSNYNASNGMMQTFQTLDIDQQFEAGVRAFDIKLIGENANIYVSTHTLSLTIGDMLDDLKKKLDAAPSEFVIVSINYVDAGLSPQQWLNAICTAINNWSRRNPRDKDADSKDGSTLNDGDRDYFREIVSTTTVGAMRHGIGIMIHYPPTDDGTTPSLTSDHVNVMSNYDTSVQNTSLVEYDITSSRGTGHVTIQNLQQMNNPDQSRYPYFITEQYALGTATSMDLIQTKKDLISSLFTLSRNNNATGGTQRTNNLYVNDLGGFCVVDNNESTGWAEGYIFTSTYHEPWFDDPYYSWDRTTFSRNITNCTDYDDVFTSSSDVDVPDASADNVGQTYVVLTDRTNSQLGQGGNNALAAEEINGKAGDLIYNLVNEGRTPLGVVYMNFAGTDQVQFDRTYTVNGVRLPSLIMSNNFKFALATSSDTTSN